MREAQPPPKGQCPACQTARCAAHRHTAQPLKATQISTGTVSCRQCLFTCLKILKVSKHLGRVLILATPSLLILLPGPRRRPRLPLVPIACTRANMAEDISGRGSRELANGQTTWLGRRTAGACPTPTAAQPCCPSRGLTCDEAVAQALRGALIPPHSQDLGWHSRPAAVQGIHVAAIPRRLLVCTQGSTDSAGNQRHSWGHRKNATLKSNSKT